MILHLLQFVSLLLVALGMGLSSSHALQWTPKAKLPGNIFLIIQKNLYLNYGPASAILEIVSSVSCLAILALLPQGTIAFLFTLIGFIFLSLMFIVWAAFIQPINRQVSTWKEDSLPSNWAQYGRGRWHTLHLIRLALAIVALGALIASVLIERP